jgi:adenosylcobyric acid synthase
VVSADGRVWGSYLHGVFDAPHVRRVLLAGLEPTAIPSAPSEDYRALREREYGRLAAVVRAHVDVAALVKLIDVRVPGARS